MTYGLVPVSERYTSPERIDLVILPVLRRYDRFEGHAVGARNTLTASFEYRHSLLRSPIYGGATIDIDNSDIGD